MIVQSIILPNEICDSEEIYIRASGQVQLHENSVNMESGTLIITDTYMNVFDAGNWYRYTGNKKWYLRISLSGQGMIRLIHWERKKRDIVQCVKIDTEIMQEVIIPFEHKEEDGMYYFEIESTRQIYLKSASYDLEKFNVQRNVRLGLNICTYHRRESLYRNLQELRASKFFDESDELYGKLKIYVVDNASELPIQKEDFFSIYHNSNTGGSGGFTRGIEEIRKDETRYGITNVIFMDDDVEVLAETFYRLYALLLLSKKEYQQEVIAGRMFRMDNRKVQYTAAEIWNGGNIQHVGWNLDMSDGKNLLQMNDNNGIQYSGWWFACFPMKFVRKNTPLPFFLHCDDVEYGLRHGGTPIILNGIQVWHETYEHRQSPVITYYDMRNSLIVNAIYGWLPKKEKILTDWKRRISEYHVKEDYLSERMLILAMLDFSRGGKYFRTIQIEKKNKRLNKKRRGIKKKNSILWRIAEKRIEHLYKKIVKSYQ